MARLPRLTLPGYPHHIIQRGNNSQPICAAPADYQTLLNALHENAQKFKVAIHAYVLMPNHFHLLASPETADGLPQLMQAVGRSYVRWFNAAQGRTGTLWEGRYKSTVIEAQTWVLPCMVYLDLNPTRAGLLASAAQVADYAWSSHAHYTGLRTDKRITPHPQYWALGNTPFAREAAYANLVRNGISLGQQTALTDAALRGWALGSPAFVANLQNLTERRVSKVKAGRPVTQVKLVK
ncbi:MAG: transposase [Burkholderiaceae bacterium]